MEFGLFTEFQCPPGRSAAAAFDESMVQMRAAEDLGFDAVWLAEIHFQKDRSVLSSPLTIAAGLATTTRRVKIGIAVQVLPLSHPLRLAEDVATVDHLSKGRLEFGVGRSGLPGHYQGFNIPYSESRDRFLETLEILRKAWTEERFSHSGKFWQFNDVCVMPKPYQRPHPPLRVAATTEETYPMVGRMGLPIFVAPRTISISDLKRRRPDSRSARGQGRSAQRHHLRRSPERAGDLRHAGGGHRSPARASRRGGLHQPVGLDESRRADPARACAHLDAAVPRARRAPPELTVHVQGCIFGP